MNKVLFIIVLLLSISIFSCSTKPPKEIKELADIFDKYQVKGSVLIFDKNNKEYKGFNLERCSVGFLPASTFKIPNSLIALEIGVITMDSVVFWNGEKRQVKSWEADMTISQAFKVSCVPFYQDLARHVGVERITHYLNFFDYGVMNVTDENIDKFWLEGDSKISQYQQINFLQKLYNFELSISKQTINDIKSIMLAESNNNYKLYAKTGWAVCQENNIGWYVGFVEANNNVYFFATNVEPTRKTDMDAFNSIRVNLTKEVLLNLKITK